MECLRGLDFKKGSVIYYLPVTGLSDKEDCAWRKPQGYAEIGGGKRI